MRIETPAVQCIFNGADYLGESPVWSAAERALYWINCQPDARLCRWDSATGAVRQWPMPERIGAVILRENGGLIVALASGLHAFERDSGELRLLVAAPHADRVYLHEGKCDRQGRLWIGSLVKRVMTHGEGGGGHFYRLDGDRLTPMIDDLSVSNGLAWSPDGTVMYCTDTLTGIVWAFDYDTTTGDISNRREFIKVVPREVSLDGASIDAEGGYWTALYRGSCVRRYAPDGSLDREIRLPIRLPTMPAFGGDKLDQLFITSARHGISDKDGEAALLGGLFRIDGLARGVPEPLFKG